MKKYRIDIDKNGNFQSAKHYLDVNEQVDERVLERARTLMIQGLMQTQYIENDGQRTLVANVPNFPTLNAYIQKEMRKKDVLIILKNLAITFSAGSKGIPVSGIIKNDDFIYVNPANEQTICLLFPIKQDSIDVTEIPSFFRVQGCSLR